MPHGNGNTNENPWRLHSAFSIPGQPVGKGRPRFSKAGRFVRVRTPERTKNFEKRVATFSTAPKIPAGIPIRTEFRFVFKRPKRLKRQKDADGLILHTKKPDGDNVEKAVNDGLCGVLFDDDSQIQQGCWSKWYGEKTATDGRVDVRVYVYEPTGTKV